MKIDKLENIISFIDKILVSETYNNPPYNKYFIDYSPFNSIEDQIMDIIHEVKDEV